MKEYEGSCYVGVVGPEIDIAECWASIQNVKLRPGDEGPKRFSATKGYEARQQHINIFMQSKHDFILLLDHDQLFEPDTLEHLRSHKLPYVSGLYMRRQLHPVAPVWFRPFAGAWPMEPWVGKVERGKLHKIGASGWGCVLIHREVIEAVRKITKGEWDVLEDDMDVWPYDLLNIMSALRGIRYLVDSRPDESALYPSLKHHLETLEAEIRPLRADSSSIVGSDIRFPFYAKAAGFQLYGDPDVRCGHNINYILSPNDYDQFPASEVEKAEKHTHKGILEQRRIMKGKLKAALDER